MEWSNEKRAERVRCQRREGCHCSFEKESQHGTRLKEGLLVMKTVYRKKKWDLVEMGCVG